MKRRWHDYDDGFDETALHEEEEFEFPAIGRRPANKGRPKLRAVSSKMMRRDKFEDETQLQRIARVKAWGLPY